jgi:hypothetical protein
MPAEEHELEQLRPASFAIAYRMLGSVSEAEDVVQEALLRVCSHGHHPAGDQRTALCARGVSSMSECNPSGATKFVCASLIRHERS